MGIKISNEEMLIELATDKKGHTVWANDFGVLLFKTFAKKEGHQIKVGEGMRRGIFG